MIELDDGGHLALDWVVPKKQDHQSVGPVLLIIPGLTGHNDDIYMVNTANAAV